jgi:hypothetical protein
MTDKSDAELNLPSLDTHSEAELLNMLESDLSNLTAKHSTWLDGKTFQQLCQRVAEAYFEQSDLYQVTLDDSTPDERAQALAAALEQEVNRLNAE